MTAYQTTFQAIVRKRGKKSAWMLAEIERREALVCGFGCLLCDWTFVGTLLKGRAASAEHRVREHGERKVCRR